LKSIYIREMKTRSRSKGEADPPSQVLTPAARASAEQNYSGSSQPSGSSNLGKRKSLQEVHLIEAERSSSKKVNRGDVLVDKKEKTDWENVIDNMKEDVGKMLSDKKRKYDELKSKEANIESVISEKTSLILALDFESETNSISYDFKMIELLESEVRLDKEMRELQSRQADLAKMKRDLEKEKERCVNEHHLENLDVRDNRAELEEEVKALLVKKNDIKWKLKRFRQISLGNDDKKKTLQRFIKNKLNVLECPVCLEEAAPPIFSCVEMHIICNSCMDHVERNTNRCPVCRVSYGKKRMRHRFAERDSEELGQLREELLELD